jgi:hypothetical protein
MHVKSAGVPAAIAVGETSHVVPTTLGRPGTMVIEFSNTVGTIAFDESTVTVSEVPVLGSVGVKYIVIVPSILYIL